MKRIFFIAIIIAFFGGATLKAQKSLEFNQVLLISSAVQTVPANKVWKIESYLIQNLYFSNSTGSCNDGYSRPFYINNKPYYIAGGGAGGSGSGGFYWGLGPGTTMPVWIPEGAALKTMCSDDVLSVIEFNIVTP